MQKLPTTFIWTSGITNVPKNNRNARYTFFELDTKDIDKLHFVLDVYRANLGSCYVHELISGYHFYNFRPIDKVAYGRIIKLIKFLNPLCPLTVLRIEPNKWQNEARYWKKGAVIGANQEEKFQTLLQAIDFKFAIENQDIEYIKNNYEVVRYPYEECPKCRLSDSIYWEYSNQCFMCKRCNRQTIGRIKQIDFSEKARRIREYENKLYMENDY